MNYRELKVLCFTPSYNRYKMVRECIFGISYQSYKNTFHSINVAHDKDSKYIEKLFDDIQIPNIRITYNINSNQQQNYMRCFEGIDIDTFDLFVKIDDDDIYKKDYVKNIVNFFLNNKDTDIVSSKITYQLNNNKMYTTRGENLGGNPEGSSFKMPMTFAFNIKALKAIISLKVNYFEDIVWRNTWHSLGLKHCEIDNSKNIIWNIHGKNISTSEFLNK